MKFHDFREDWWYEILRLIILFAVVIFLTLNLHYAQGNRSWLEGNRRVNCEVLKQSPITDQSILERDCAVQTQSTNP